MQMNVNNYYRMCQSFINKLILFSKQNFIRKSSYIRSQTDKWTKLITNHLIDLHFFCRALMPIFLAYSLRILSDLYVFTIRCIFFCLLVIFINYFSDFLFSRLKICYYLIVSLLIATFTQASRMVSAVFVLAICCKLFIASLQITKMT